MATTAASVSFVSTARAIVSVISSLFSMAITAAAAAAMMVVMMAVAAAAASVVMILSTSFFGGALPLWLNGLVSRLVIAAFVHVVSS